MTAAMHSTALAPISSRDNALIKTLHRLATEPGAYRKLGQIWLEGEHLVSSYLGKAQQANAGPDSHPDSIAFQAGLTALNAKNTPKKLIVAQSYAPQLPRFLASYGLDDGSGRAPCPVQWVDDKLLPAISSLESPAPIGLLLSPAADLPAPALQKCPTVVLDRLQDAGNVGAILRCAAAFGFRQIVAIKGTVALYSPKVLRAGMGAHFSLQLHEQQDTEASIAALQALKLPLLATSSHQGDWLHQAQLPADCAWLMGHEGQGVSAAWQAAATGHIRIWQASEESLNVATAAAICLHASAAQAMLSS